MYTYQFLIVRVTRSTLADSPQLKSEFHFRFRFGSLDHLAITGLGQRVSIVLDFFSETRDRPGLILHTFLPFYYRRCPSRMTGWKLKLCKVTIE